MATRYPFSYSLVFLTLCVAAGVTLLCLLGFWQLQRGQQKAQILSQAALAKNQPILTAAQLQQLTMGELAPYRFRRILLNGKFLDGNVILLDNKINRGKVGYHVVVPLRLKNGNLILINRGWIPLGASRQHIPVISPINDEVTIEGFLDFAYRNPLISTALETPGIQWPLRMQQLELPLLEKCLGEKILPMLVNLNSNSVYAFVVTANEFKPVMSPERHYGYAFQWFSLAAVLMIIYSVMLKKYQAKENE